MAVIGSALTGGTGNWIHVNEDGNNQRAIILPSFTVPANGYLYRLGGFVRRSNQNNNGKQPKIWWAVWTVKDGAPYELLGYTPRMPVGNNGNDISANLIWANPNYTTPGTTGAVRVTAGMQLALGFKVEVENIELAQVGPNTPHYRREFHPQGVPPTNPFDPGGAPYEKTFAVYAEWLENTQPVAVPTQPANGGSVNPASVVFQGVMADGQSGAPYRDRMSQYQLEVRRSIDDVLMWFGTFPADAAEQAANTFIRGYQGLVVLEPGLQYTWRAMVADSHGTWSGWSGWQSFTVNQLGAVTTTDQLPTGKVDTPSAALTWGGRWTHPTTNRAANAVRVRVVRASDLSPVKQSPDIAKAIAWTSATPPGTAFTVSAAEAQIGTLPGGAYAYQIQARATTGEWSPWSAPRFFQVNRLPTIPTNLQPPAGSFTSSPTLDLEWNTDDPDEDDVFGVDGYSEVKLIRPNGSTVTLDNIYTYDAATGKGRVTLGPAQLNGPGSYRWQVRAKEILSSGGPGASDWSVLQTFEWDSDGPVVVVTSPTHDGTVTTVRPEVSFGVASGTMTSYEVRLYAVDEALPLKSSGVVAVPATSSTSFTFPAGWIRNGRRYDLEVVAWSGSNRGASQRVEFLVDFAPAPSLEGLEVTAITDQDDPQEPRVQTSVALASWVQSNLNPGEFGGYNVYRRLASEEEWTLLRTLTAVGQNRWRDYWAPPNEVLLYGVSQIQRIGLTSDAIDEVESEILEAQVELDLFVPVLNSVFDPYLRMAVMWQDDDLDGSTDRPKASYVTWGSNNKATTITTPAEYATRKTSTSITLRSDPRGTLRDHVQRWMRLVSSGHPVCYRPQWSEEMMYAEIESWSWSRGDPGQRVIDFSLKEIDFTPGAEGGS